MPTSTPGQATPATRSKAVGTSVTSTIDNKGRAEVKIHVRKPLILFYIDGAGDKRKDLPLPGIVAGPFRNVLDARAHVNANERWIIKAGPTINRSLDVNHADAGIIFNRKLAEEKTTADLVVDVMRRCTK